MSRLRWLQRDRSGGDVRTEPFCSQAELRGFFRDIIVAPQAVIEVFVAPCKGRCSLHSIAGRSGWPAMPPRNADGGDVAKCRSTAKPPPHRVATMPAIMTTAPRLTS